VTPHHLAYHFTHISNLIGILEVGELRCDALVVASAALATETADPGLKERRRRFPVPCGPGGCLANYVPFYFAPRSPMLLRVATGRVPDYSEGQDPLVFVVVDADVVAMQYPVVMTDGHPLGALSTFFTDLGELDARLDWQVMNATYWNDTDADGDRMRRRQAELLVLHHIALGDTLGLACRTEATRLAVEQLLEAFGRSHAGRCQTQFLL
jgi:hypothetical protein